MSEKDEARLEEYRSSAVDEFADGLDPDDVVNAARECGLTVDEFLGRLVAEVKARVEAGL